MKHPKQNKRGITKMINTKKYESYNKKELLAMVLNKPIHTQPKWKNKANKDELIGWLASYDEAFNNEVTQ